MGVPLRDDPLADRTKGAGVTWRGIVQRFWVLIQVQKTQRAFSQEIHERIPLRTGLFSRIQCGSFSTALGRHVIVVEEHGSVNVQYFELDLTDGAHESPVVGHHASIPGRSPNFRRRRRGSRDESA